MHVAIIFDKDRLETEGAMLHRLSIGLLDEGARITRVVPNPSHAEPNREQFTSLTTTLKYMDQVVPWLRKDRVQQLMDQMEREPPDVVYVNGRRAWRMASILAEKLQKPLVYDIWSTASAKRAPRHDSQRHVSYVCATKPINALVGSRVGSERCLNIPIGVTIPENSTDILANESKTISVVILGWCRDVAAYRILLSALSRLLNEYPNLQIFLELNGPREHDIWKLVQRNDLSQVTSSLMSADLHRPLVTCCDLVLIPESGGSVRTIILEAMAAGIPLLAVHDSALDFIISDQTGQIIKNPTPDRWETLLRRAISQPIATKELGAGARQWISENHPSSKHAAALFKVLQEVSHGRTYPFIPA